MRIAHIVTHLIGLLGLLSVVLRTRNGAAITITLNSIALVTHTCYIISHHIASTDGWCLPIGSGVGSIVGASLLSRHRSGNGLSSDLRDLWEQKEKIWCEVTGGTMVEEQEVAPIEL